ncbi:MAG: hypothetical protein AV945_gp43 [Phormidium phage MIS-PhV1B]|jgi:hypothetical protein|uniref:hypothetical protein n=1 Tax=Phormidium phage MIS-PhV1B TaxID=1391456 RepID=UPI0003C93818|nr:MAG: hypothetical protein AV945_gp43 [Phormidium phage MIS-PhV1B]AGZ61850.1 MAG: hypothetical protein [Phormidium phage MIS-PhV1B]
MMYLEITAMTVNIEGLLAEFEANPNLLVDYDDLTEFQIYLLNGVDILNIEFPQEEEPFNEPE